MSTLRVLAMLAIAVGCAPAHVIAEQSPAAQLPELDEMVAAAFTEPGAQTGQAHVTPERCPYRFDSDMPAATFCVYRGVALGGAGEVCGTEVVVIWSSFASPVNGGPAKKAAVSDREVYLGFAADPELVVRAIVDSRQGDRAEVVEYTLEGEEALRPVAGQMTLRAVRLGSADVLTMDLREPRRFHPGTCAFASYSGTFLGMMHSPSETTPSVDPFIAPRQ